MKKLIIMLLCISIIATLVGCSQQTAHEPQETTELINGTFEGTAAGM